MEKFSKYFNEWLYAKDGYYANYKPIGKDGDFYTSVSTSQFFGGTIAKKILTTIKTGKLKENTTILEIGSHHGYLLADIIQFVYTFEPKLLKTLTFAIVERFENLRVNQEKYLRDSFGYAINLKFYNNIEEVKLSNAFIVSNEIFDAFSCELVYSEDDILKQAYVDNHKISFKKCEDEKLINHCKKYKITKGEVSLEYESFVNIICENIERFEFVTFDYGQLSPRNDISVRVYENHNVHPIFEENLKLEELYKVSDITYDVNFSHIIDIFKENGIAKIELKTQLCALVDFGIIELLEILKENSSEQTYLKELQKVKILLDVSGMGERFKMLKVERF